MLFYLLISLYSFHSSFSLAYTPDGYIGCFVDLIDRILDGKSRKSLTNSGDECIEYCKTNGYRYAGTEFSEECYCGNKLRIKNYTNRCKHSCLGNIHEICGGHWSISVYDIFQIPTTTISSTIAAQRKITDSSLVVLYVTAPLGFFVLLLILFLGMFARRRRLRKRKTRLENISDETSSIPNNCATIVSSHKQKYSGKTEKSKTDIKSCVNDFSFATGTKGKETQSICQTANDIDNYDSLEKQHIKNGGLNEKTYDHVVNYIHGDYSITSSNQFSSGYIDDNNIYSQTRYSVKGSTGKNYADSEDNMYNTLQLKSTKDREATKTVPQISNYGTTVAIASAIGNGEYSHINEIVPEK